MRDPIPGQRGRGLALTALGVLLMSPDALVVRLAGGDAVSSLAVRNVTLGLGLGVLALFWPTPRPRAWGPTLLVGLGAGVGSGLFVYAVTHATAADALIGLATQPLSAALIARFALGEHLPRRTLAAIGLAMIAIGVVASGQPIGGGLGLLAGIGCGTLFSANMNLIRRFDRLDPFTGVAMGFFIAGLIAAFFVPLPDLPAGRWTAILMLTLICLPLSFALVAIGPRRLPAPVVALLMLGETTLGPVWVWAVFYEVPSGRTLLGGGLLIATLIAHAVFEMRAARVVHRAGALMTGE
ncbi:MAG: EamA family transporter [Myxococcales bacterium]|nr:EamA family transporter [Myxococcales bacterium]